MRRALVLGVNGQDGSYLAESLLRRGWLVHGAGRQDRSRWLAADENFDYHSLDIGDLAALSALLKELQPDFVCHLAAVHGAAGFAYEDQWQAAHAVNTLSVHAVLEHLRRDAPRASLIYGSSSKVFGPVPPPLVSEATPRLSTCIYSTTKNAATDLINYYRSRHGLRASSVWLFNHESARRSGEYFVPRIVEILANSICEPGFCGSIVTLQFFCDWGDAAEYMDLIAGLAETSAGNDLILASGSTWHAEAFVDQLFRNYGLRWQDHMVETLAPPGESQPAWRADVSALARHCSRTPQRNILQVCDDILRSNHPEAWRKRPRKAG